MKSSTRLQCERTVSTRVLLLCFEHPTRAIDSSKHQPSRCDRAREFRSLVGTPRTGGWKQHRQGGVNSLDNDKYVAKMKSLAQFEASRIYLATDDADAPRLFKDAFGERVVVRDGVSRVGEGHEVHMCEMNLKPATLTEACDVLIDALLLAKCDVLVCGSSAVSLAVRFMKPAIETHYVRS